MTDRQPPDAAEQPASWVPCPICLAWLNWESLAPQKPDKRTGRMQPLDIPAGVGWEQYRTLLRDSFRQCPNPMAGLGKGDHYLPNEYGNHGRPLVYGLVGTTRAGKTHLLAAFVKLLRDAVDELAEHGIRCAPVDRKQDQEFRDEYVLPLFTKGAALEPTQERVESFADAFVVTAGGQSRVVAFFDLAGGDLRRVEVEKQFLEIVDGVVFIVDPVALGQDARVVEGDLAFTTVMDLLVTSGRAHEVASAIALTKGDLVRFDEPLDFWWRQPLARTRAALHAESRDVYAYIDSRGGQAWLRPVVECGQSTLHLLSSTGGSSAPRKDGSGEVFSRDVEPHRALGPFLALLAMNGVITLPDAADGVVGVRRVGP
jgi:hypothetical protein